MFSKKQSLYIPRIYPATILKYLDVYKAVYDTPYWTKIIAFNVQEGIRAYVTFLFEYLGYGTTQRVDLTQVNDFYQADVYLHWEESSDSREFQYEISAGNYRVYHPDQSHWIIAVNTKKFDFESFAASFAASFVDCVPEAPEVLWVVDTKPDPNFVLPPDYWDPVYYDDPSYDYDFVYWY